LARDLGLQNASAPFVKSIYEGATGFDPLAMFEDFNTADEIRLSPGGAVCLIAYWLFSKDVFESDSRQPEMYLFPDHITLLQRFLGSAAQDEVIGNPGIADALLAIGLALDHRNLVTAGTEPNIMAYHHYLTLVAVFHPDIQVRNAATVFAGSILHSDPDEQGRLEILEDLLENCIFASLKACAVTWLKEELVAARKRANKDGGDTSSLPSPPSIFASPDTIDRLQYLIFPDMLAAKDTLGPAELADHWAQNGPFLLQAANFAVFLFSGGFRDLVPAGVAAAVEQRFVEPLVEGAQRLFKGDGALGESEGMSLSILVERLKSLPS
jgi:hypothetical protein